MGTSTGNDSLLPDLLAPDLISDLGTFINNQLRAMVRHIERVVTQLRATFPQIQAVWVMDAQGEALCSSTELPLDVPRAAAMMATAAALGQRFLDITDADTLTDLRLLGTEEQVIMYRAPDSVTLVVMVPLDMNFGLLTLEARQAAAVIGHLARKRQFENRP